MSKRSVFYPTDILLPKQADMTKWATIACDQFSSEPEYWESVSEYVGDSPSTLNMMLPEAWLEGADMDAVSERICAYMDKYLREGVLCTVKNSYVYVERSISGGKMRRGIVGALDLDSYSFDPESNAPVKASENTVLDRLPPRITMRVSAELEMPHVMVLIDDPESTVIESLGNNKAKMEPLYDFDLMKGGGHIGGYRVSGDMAQSVISSLESLGSQEQADKKYGKGTRPVLMIIGDGNHSLAAAKACWDDLKPSLTENERENHPARFALVEMNNIHDSSLEIEPIHRAVFGADREMIENLKNHVKGLYGDKKGYTVGYFLGGDRGDINVGAETIGLAIGAIQGFIDKYSAETGCAVDYIHGDDTLAKLNKRADVAGFYMPAIDKSDLFASVIKSGVFPKKSFSMGQARDKRYYLEARKIK